MTTNLVYLNKLLQTIICEVSVHTKCTYVESLGWKQIVYRVDIFIIECNYYKN
jgi:hypothetical protein